MNASGSLMGRFDTASVITATVPSGIAYNPTNLTLAITDNNSDQVKIISFPILNNFAEFCDCDLNKDGSCNILDYQRFIQDWGRSNCP
jgi:DNA-binding beta-propeller fold protein YncE